MSQWKLYHNPQCSKSREALQLLEAQELDFQVVEYLKNPLSVNELKELIGQMKDPVSSLVRVKEVEFVENPFDVSSVDEVAQHLSLKPRLMERPLLQGNGRAVIGRPLENFTELLKNN
ncbi:MAG: ArsC/Spx/MgsR family protein [Bdellovibrio sp.]